MNSNLLKSDVLAYDIVQKEKARQHEHLEMIASENFVSLAVLEASGSILTNKYAEGYPGKRYYSGCEMVDLAENLARDRAKKLFGANYVNVQPHSGSQANMGVLFSLLNVCDTVLAMNLAHGGHLNHGSPVNFSGKFYNIVSYGVRKDTGRIDYDEVLSLAKTHKPKMIICGASAYSRAIDFAKFRDIADQVDALLFADMAHIAGLVATGHHQNPVDHCHVVTTTTHKTLRGPRGGMILTKDGDVFEKKLASQIFPGIQGGPMMHTILAKAVAFGEALDPSFKTYSAQVIKNCQTLASELTNKGYELTTGGTDNHLVLLDLRNKNVTGKDAEKALETAGIAVNKNMVPFDDKSPFITSGIRIGTPALTTRGMQESEMIRIASWIDQAITSRDSQESLVKIATEIKIFCADYPIFKN